jgi:hypothetical protein
MGFEAFICCYFDQEDRDCVGVEKKSFYSLTKMFSGWLFSF